MKSKRKAAEQPPVVIPEDEDAAYMDAALFGWINAVPDAEVYNQVGFSVLFWFALSCACRCCTTSSFLYNHAPSWSESISSRV